MDRAGAGGHCGCGAREAAVSADGAIDHTVAQKDLAGRGLEGSGRLRGATSTAAGGGGISRCNGVDRTFGAAAAISGSRSLSAAICGPHVVVDENRGRDHSPFERLFAGKASRVFLFGSATGVA